MHLRPGVIAVILSVRGSGEIESASVDLGAESAGANETETLGTEEQQQFFEKQVRPLFIKRCYQCHSSEAKVLKGGLHLDSRNGWMKGGDSGPAVVPGIHHQTFGVSQLAIVNPSADDSAVTNAPPADIDHDHCLRTGTGKVAIRARGPNARRPG